MSEDKDALKFLDFDDPEGGVIAYSVESGNIADEAANEIWARIDKAAAKGGKLSIYCEMRGFPSVDSAMVIEKFKRLGAIFSTIDRFAIVGDQGWLDIYAKIVDPITGFDIRSFSTDQVAQARAWVTGNA